MRYLSRWLAEHDRPATLDELTRPAISAWLAELTENWAAVLAAPAALDPSMPWADIGGHNGLSVTGRRTR